MWVRRLTKRISFMTVFYRHIPAKNIKLIQIMLKKTLNDKKIIILSNLIHDQ